MPPSHLADLLPELAEPLSDAAAITHYAQSCLHALGLCDWTFCWDKAKRRLGCCRPDKKAISLSEHFVRYYLEQGEPSLIQRVILHEIAHALAAVHHRARGHGIVWKHYCAELGIAGEKASTRCDDFVRDVAVGSKKKQAKYALVIGDTGELVRHYYVKPRRSAAQWKNCYLPGRKSETLGKLKLIEIAPVDHAASAGLASS